MPLILPNTPTVMKQFLIIITLLLTFINLNAQCIFNSTAITTESRCKETGTIAITTIPAGLYSNAIIAGPKTFTGSNTSLFTGLPSGSYTITTTNSICTDTTIAIVSGNYQDPSLLTATLSYVRCPNGTGSLTANPLTGGRPPFVYSIIAGPVTRPLQNSPNFDGLIAGTYSLQAQDSCGVVRTTEVALPYDTSSIFAEVYGYDLGFTNCNDLVVRTLTNFSGAITPHAMRVWYIKPNGDTVKINGFEFTPIAKDTIIGEARTYGTWKILAVDSCGRFLLSTFVNPVPMLINDFPSKTCGGYTLKIANNWKYGDNIGYIIKNKATGAVIHNYLDTTKTQFFSPIFTLEYDTTYELISYNLCGDTVKKVYSNSNTIPYSLSGACAYPGGNEVGTGSFMIGEAYLSSIRPSVIKIIGGPSHIGDSMILSSVGSWVDFHNLTIGTYTIQGTDACGNTTVSTVLVNKPLIRNIEISQLPNCSGGSDLKIKVESNMKHCAYPYDNLRIANLPATYISASLLQNSGPPTCDTCLSVWESVYFNVSPTTNFPIDFWLPYQPHFDTNIIIYHYIAPTLANVAGHTCVATGKGSIYSNLIGGRAPFQYRIRPLNTTTWSPWVPSAVFDTVVNNGTYEMEMQDACPNGFISVFDFKPFRKANAMPVIGCISIGEKTKLQVDTVLPGVTYEWVRNGIVMNVGPIRKINSFQYDDTTYILRQTFPGGTCIESAKATIIPCWPASFSMDQLLGYIQNNNVYLQWRTLQEEEGIVFEVQKRKLNGQFKTLDIQLGQNNQAGSQYTFTDTYGLTENNEYRIAFKRANGEVGYSNTISLSKINKEAEVYVSPTAFTNQLKINIVEYSQETSQINIYNLTGSKIFTKEVQTQPGITTVVLENEISELVNGMYLLEVQTFNGVFKQRIYKK